MSARDFSINDYIKLMGSTPATRGLRWQTATDHAERIEILESVLDDIYSRLVDARGLKKHRGEDELSMDVVNMMSTAGIAARHDQHVNGHCDIVVESQDGFMWLGEAKVHKDYGWLEDGFLQLSTRYGVAMLGRNHGELLIYHRDGNSLSVLREWKKRLTTLDGSVKITCDIAEPKLFFRTAHKCKNSGCTFNVRHSIIPLTHAPEK